jgi:uncharacterized SAM-binding protein YcdF (DUF218 family)
MKYIIGAVLLFVGTVLALSFYLQPNDFGDCGNAPATGTGLCTRADAIVVVSGGDTNARTDAGIQLYQNDWADTIIFSGAALDPESPSNAAAMRERALAYGVPSTAVVLEEDARSTQENAENTQTLFEQRNIDKVILVTSGYHQRRALIEFERRSDGVEILNKPLASDQDWSAWWWLTPRGWWLAGGEMVKIVVTQVTGDRL